MEINYLVHENQGKLHNQTGAGNHKKCVVVIMLFAVNILVSTITRTIDPSFLTDRTAGS